MEEKGRFGVSGSWKSPAQATQQPSHQILTPASGNKLSHLPRHRPVLSYHLLFFTFLICFAPLCSASLYIKEQMVETRENVEESPGSTFARLAKSGVILVDQSEPPKPLDWTLVAAAADDLRRRDDPFGNDSGSSSNSTSPKTTAKHGSTTTLTPTPTSSSGGIATATMANSQSPLPIPFDSGFSANITASCAGFMQNMLGNSTFQQCLPFSLLLQVSPFSQPFY